MTTTKKMLVCMCLTILTLTSQAQNWMTDNALWKVVSAPASNWTAAFYPSIAPDLKVDGVSKKFGGGFALFYPVTEYVRTGVRVDYLGDKLWMPSVDAQLQASVKLLNKVVVTPFVYGGIAAPIGGHDGDPVQAISGTGMTARLFEWKNGDICAGYAVEKWSGFEGLVHHPGIVLHWRF